jgi:uncharacterized integral membrane protein (TIGR00697 family)
MNELLWLLMLLFNFGAILFIYRVYGKTGLYIWVPIAAIVANIQVLKNIELFGFTTTLGNIVYASSFLVTDILSENYGKQEAKKAVFIGFFALVSATILMNMALWFEPAASDMAQGPLETIFSLLPRIAGASFLAYLVSQLHDVWAFHKWKSYFPEVKFLWLRNCASTVVSQLLDTAVFTFAAFLGRFPLPIVLEILWTTYIIKLLVAAADTPFLYIARRWKHTSKVPPVTHEKRGP